MDETVVNGAQIFYKKEFSIDDDKDSVSAELAQRSKSYIYLPINDNMDPSAFYSCFYDPS